MIARWLKINWGGPWTGYPVEPIEVRPGYWVAHPYPPGRWVVERTDGGPLASMPLNDHPLAAPLWRYHGGPSGG